MTSSLLRARQTPAGRRGRSLEVCLRDVHRARRGLRLGPPMRCCGAAGLQRGDNCGGGRRGGGVQPHGISRSPDSSVSPIRHPCADGESSRERPQLRPRHCARHLESRAFRRAVPARARRSGSGGQAGRRTVRVHLLAKYTPAARQSPWPANPSCSPSSPASRSASSPRRNSSPSCARRLRADPGVPFHEYNLPKPGHSPTGKTPVIYEAAFRREG